MLQFAVNGNDILARFNLSHGQERALSALENPRRLGDGLQHLEAQPSQFAVFLGDRTSGRPGRR